MGSVLLGALSGAAAAVLALWVLLCCALPLFRRRPGAEVWAILELPDKKSLPIRGWECVLGRSSKADIPVTGAGVGRNHAVLERSETGGWTVCELGKGNVWVNGRPVEFSAPVKSGDTLRLGETKLRFRTLSESQRRALQGTVKPARPSRPFFTLALLTAFQLLVLMQQLVFSPAAYRLSVGVGFAALMVMEWAAVSLLRRVGTEGWEPVMLSLLLTTAGFSVAASSTPGGMVKQSLLLAGGLGAFFALRWLLSDMGRARSLRWPMAFGAMGFLALNLLLSERVWGAKNWLSIAGQSLQPSEFVKIAYIFAGAAALDRLYRKRYLILFVAFSAVIVSALAMMGDFGTALVFFVCFLMIFFLRSGSLLTVLLALLAGTGAAGMVLTLKPYVARRFLSWGHAWETPLNEGFQQVRAMSAAAAGGLFGRGAGNGWLRDVVAADTDLVFALVCEEQGLIVGACCVLAIALLALYAFRGAARSRSSFNLIAACAAVTVFLAQTVLNVFGSLDLLPFTGVTFPFVSRGGSSLISCWALLAFVTASRESPSPAPMPGPSPIKAKKPAEKSTTKLATKPAAKPTAKPAAKPSVKPTAKPATKPSVKPTAKPTAKPSVKPAAKPTAKAGSKRRART